MAHEVGMTRLNSGQDYAVTIPEGYAAGDIVVIRLMGKVFVEADVLEGLVRAYHELDEGPIPDETGLELAVCACGWKTFHRDRRDRQAQHATHVEHVVREALAGRAAL